MNNKYNINIFENDRHTVFQTVYSELSKLDFKVVSCDEQRPWGGFFVIDEAQSAKFIRTFFSDLNSSKVSGLKLSPKILLVAPQKKLSWQYHHRRSEIWKLIAGEASIVRSFSDEETEMLPMANGELVELMQGERHRLIGANEWGVVAEIWQHTDPLNPSNEDDIVRLQDDFGRESPKSKNLQQ